MEKIKLFSEDGLNLVGNYSSSKGSAKGALLLHMYQRSKEDWKDFAEMIAQRGYKVLAMDLRGHGESDGDIQKIFSQDLNLIILKDVELAMDFLKKDGAQSIFIIGASIGANAALIYGAKHNVAGIALLSPGLDYHGANIEVPMKNYSRPIFLAASEDDSYSTETVKKIYDFSSVPKDKKVLILYKNAGHGTQMFGKENPDLSEKLTEWLESIN
ncbi:MAG: alpha/beta fold hydrolase [Patescibacteria group bacterium]